MRVTIFALALGTLVCATCANGSGPPAAGSAHAPAKDSITRLDIRTPDGTPLSVRVAKDATVSTRARRKSVKVIGEVKGVAIVVVDTYASKPGGMSLCQAGEEQFLRVISVKPPRETARIKLASCRDNIELASPGLEWSAESQALKVDWLMGPTGSGKPETRTIRIGADGHFQ